MEKLLAELLTTAASPLIAAIEAKTAALNRNSDLLERVVAGQEAAMAKLEGGSAATTRKPRQTAAEKKAEAEAAAPPAEKPVTPPTEKPVATAAHALLAAPNGETIKVKNPKTGVDEDTPTVAFRAADFSRDQVKAEFIGWLGETNDPDIRKERANFVAAIGQHFGVKQPFHPSEGLLDDDARKQTLFFLRRKREGLAVDFSADYDFDADPLADQSTEAADDGFDALG